jgi:putative oxidoreductase
MRRNLRAMDALRPWLSLLVRVFIGGYFVVAAVPKIIEPLAFATSIMHYGLVPSWSVNAIALILAWLELIAGIGLIMGIRTKVQALFCGGMLVAFTLAVAYAVVLGLKIDCGCFGASGGEEVSWLKVAKNSAMIIGCIYLWWSPRSVFSIDHGLWGRTT